MCYIGGVRLLRQYNLSLFRKSNRERGFCLMMNLPAAERSFSLIPCVDADVKPLPSTFLLLTYNPITKGSCGTKGRPSQSCSQISLGSAHN